MKHVHLKMCPMCDGAGKVTDESKIGEDLRKLRKSANLSLREVARRMGYSAPYVSDLELGRRNWHLSTIEKFEAACSPCWKPQPQFKL